MGNRGGPMDDFPEPPRSLLPGRFGPMDDFDNRMGGPPGSKGGLPGRPDDFEMRPGGREKDLRPPGRMDEFDRGLPLRGPPFDFDPRRGRNLPGDLPPFDIGRGPILPPPDEFELREEFERRRELFLADKFGGPPGLMGPGGSRSLMGVPDNFGPRGGRGLGRFHFVFILYDDFWNFEKHYNVHSSHLKLAKFEFCFAKLVNLIIAVRTY